MGQGLGQARNPEVGTSYFLAKNKEKVLKSCDFRTFMARATEIDTAWKCCIFKDLRLLSTIFGFQPPYFALPIAFRLQPK